MSTRCVITVIDEYDRFSIYRHCDGYPQSDHGVVFTLKKAFSYARELPDFEAGDFAAAIIRAWKKEGGGNICLTNSSESHGDLAYCYEITCQKGQIHLRVYSPRHGKVYYDGLFDNWNDDDFSK